MARVFNQKLTRLMDLCTKGRIYGDVQAYMYSVEWQKRGLPHAHILLWLKDKIHASDIDKLISAELPDPKKDQKLYDIVSKHMVHGPHGPEVGIWDSPCLRDKECEKHFPKRFTSETQIGEDGYPTYKGRSPEEGGHTSFKKIKNRTYKIDNRWIVPYSPLLCRAFDAHINVEWCNSVKSIKYVCKYVNKGPDAAMFALLKENTRDEVAQFEQGRYISTNEAAWRIFGFPIHGHYPTVLPLAVHLENGQRVYFTEENVAEVVNNPKDTTLQAFFKLCQKDSFARTLLYPEVPSYFRWVKNKWIPRKETTPVEGFPGYFKDAALGRVYTIHPNLQECYFLRLLLHEVRGPTSFDELKRVNGEVCQTFREACNKLGLLEDDAHWMATLEEAATCVPARKIRDLFAIMLTQCGEIADPLKLWTTFRESMSEDIRHQSRLHANDMSVDFTDHMFKQALLDLEDKVLELGGENLQKYGLPTVDRSVGRGLEPREVLRERAYNFDDLRNFIEENEPKLRDNEDQKHAYDTFVQAAEGGEGGLFFLDAPGGTGKTFVTNLLMAKIRQQKKIVAAVASTGIAAQLLVGGRTSHSTFKLPLDMTTTDTPTCNVSRGSGLAEMLRQCSLIVWDECTMSRKQALEALDRLLKDLRKSSSLMGNVTVVLSGDFRQTLPVIKRGTKANELKECLKSSTLWKKVKVLKLTTNMRAKLSGDASSAQFAKNLLQLGDGKAPQDEEGLIDITPISRVVTNQDGLISSVFPNLEARFKDLKWLSERAILAPKNVMVNGLNHKLLSKIPGPERSYKSVDTAMDVGDATEYPVEFLNSLDPSGFPPHNLSLKEGAPVMLLRNLRPPTLCNGTKLVVTKLLPNVIKAKVLTGSGKGDEVMIPRIPLISSPSDLAFSFKRLQFPVRLCFAMSINKSQGQTLKVAGLQLQEPCFSHGQLYVACSRVGSKNNLFTLCQAHRKCKKCKFENCGTHFHKTVNIVYPSALQ